MEQFFTTLSEVFGSVFYNTHSYWVYRLYNPVTGEHFYTINQNEVIACAKMGFTFEGSAFHVPLKGKLIPVYRMFCSKVAAGAHRFVEDETEVARLEATGNWVKEGIAWYTIAK